MTPALAEEDMEVATRAAANPKTAALLPSIALSSLELVACALMMGIFSTQGSIQDTEDAFELSSNPFAPEIA